MAIRAVVFDIGGIFEVIPGGGDPTRRYPEMIKAWDERLGVAPGTLARQIGKLDDHFTAAGKDGAIGTCTEEEWFAGLRAVTGMDEATFAAFVRDFWEIYLGEPNTELMEYFRGLRPRYRTALLSNSFVGAREREEERFHFAELAEFIVYSHECGFSKPDRRIYELTRERLGVLPEEMLFLDDAEPNVAAARDLGIHAILFKDNAQAITEIEARLQENA